MYYSTCLIGAVWYSPCAAPIRIVNILYVSRKRLIFPCRQAALRLRELVDVTSKKNRNEDVPVIACNIMSCLASWSQVRYLFFRGLRVVRFVCTVYSTELVCRPPRE